MKRERTIDWLYNHHLLPGFAYGWWLDRRCPHCGEQRFAHPHGYFGGWQ